MQGEREIEKSSKREYQGRKILISLEAVLFQVSYYVDVKKRGG